MPSARLRAVSRLSLIHIFGGRVWIVSKCGPRVQSLTERWLEHNDFFSPVSYTHLDVYKRQPENHPSGRPLRRRACLPLRCATGHRGLGMSCPTRQDVNDAASHAGGSFGGLSLCFVRCSPAPQR